MLCHGWMPPRAVVSARVCTLQGGRSDQSTVAAAGRVARSSCFANIGGLLMVAEKIHVNHCESCRWEGF